MSEFKEGENYMYTEEEYDTRNRRRGSFPLRDFLLKLILIIIFVLLLIWLVPWPNQKQNKYDD